jgi:hypothetical protein
MQIKIRQCNRDGATLENTTALANFFISMYRCHKVRFTHPSESEISMAGGRTNPKVAITAHTEQL